MLAMPRTRRIVVPNKAAAVNAFVAGKSIADIAHDTANHRLRVEQVIREALVGLASLNASLATPPDAAVEAMQSEIDQIVDAAIARTPVEPT